MAGVVAAVAFVQLEAADPLIVQSAMEIGKDPAGFGSGKIGHQSAPDQVVSAIGDQVLVNGRRRVGKSVLPKIHMKALLPKLIQ